MLRVKSEGSENFTNTRHQIRGHPKESGKNAQEPGQQYLRHRETVTEDDAPGKSHGEPTKENGRVEIPANKATDQEKEIDDDEYSVLLYAEPVPEDRESTNSETQRQRNRKPAVEERVQLRRKQKK
ncbi:hypothetical protein RB195_006908 [Necator americanus]|uniref:Uncharacterized protein n=1 Tax=Necator americanus TaxID=51031 RepID=A0ABR1BWG5_NECAM